MIKKQSDKVILTADIESCLTTWDVYQTQKTKPSTFKPSPIQTANNVYRLKTKTDITNGSNLEDVSVYFLILIIVRLVSPVQRVPSYILMMVALITMCLSDIL